jgi:hypothetical protein
MTEGLAILLSDDFIAEVARAVGPLVAEQRRWAEIETCAAYLGCDVRRVRDLRARGLPARKVGKRLIFDLRAVDAWLEAQP